MRWTSGCGRSRCPASRRASPGQQIGTGTAFQGFEARPHSLAPEPTAPEQDQLAGTSFSLTGETDDEGSVSIWGRGAVTHLAGRDAAGAAAGGDVAVDGEVATGLLGADWTRGPWTTGLLLTHSEGDGGYRGAGGGAVASTLTGVWPWTRYAVGERLSAWGVAGYGDGSLTLEPRRRGRHAGRGDPDRPGSLDGGGRSARRGARRGR